MAQGEGGMSAEELAERFSRSFPRSASSSPASEAANSGAAVGDAPVRVTEHSTRGIHVEAVVGVEEVVAAARWMDAEGFALGAVTGVDWMAEGQMEVIYDYFHPGSGMRVAIRARVARESAEVPTISEVFPGANWHERETHDFFGIRFRGHPNLVPLLLPEDATYHPLRKDFGGA
jgi:NADH-quinone oxidoreductase subunit C